MLCLQTVSYRSWPALLSAGCCVFVGSLALCLLRKIGSTLLCASQLLERVPINFKQVTAHSKEVPAQCVHFGNDGLWDQGEIIVSFQLHVCGKYAMCRTTCRGQQLPTVLSA